VTKKILLLVLLAGFAAVATEALSQSPGGATPSTSPASSSTPSKVTPPVSSAPFKSDATGPSAKETTAKDASKENPSSKSATSGKDAAKETPSSRTIPTSTVTSSPSVPKTLVVERALVTLIFDNKVPAAEAGMLFGPLPVEEGSSVEKDELVAQIDNRSTLAKQKIAEAEYLGAKAQSENDAEVEVAEAAINVAQQEYEMSKEIRDKNPQAVSLSQLRKDKFNWEKSLAQKKQAVNEKHIAGLTANAKYAQFEAASIELDLRQVKAPFKGEVVEIMKRPGDWVTVGEPIMRIVGLDKVRVKGIVIASGSEGAVAADVFGKKVEITVEMAGGKKTTVEGKIGFASPVIEGVGSSRQFRVWAEVDNKKTTDPTTGQVTWALQPGSVGTMKIDMTPPKPQSGATKTQTYKPVTGDEKSGSKKSKSREF